MNLFCHLKTGFRWTCLIASLWAASLAAISCAAQEAACVYTNLPDYLSRRTWIREVVFDLSKKVEGFTTIKASLQPNGFFFEYLTNSPYPGLYTYGESKDEFWQVTPTVIDIAKKDPAMGGTESNRLQTICRTRERLIAYVLNFGIDGLDNNNIRWLSTNEFTSPLLNWTGDPIQGSIKVKITSFYEGLPYSLECETASDKGRQHLQISCRYSDPCLPPSEVDIKKTENGQVSFLTNVIQNVAFGLRSDAAGGFAPAAFYHGKSAALREIESNGLAYVAQTNGALHLIGKSKTFPPEMAYRARKLTFLRVGFVLLTVVPLGLLFYRITSKPKPPK